VIRTFPLSALPKLCNARLNFSDKCLIVIFAPALISFGAKRIKMV
jgi:hypothetical protein